jgi:FKBP-type peptidyl-prolyl cis-trans isomerase SlyD
MTIGEDKVVYLTYTLKEANDDGPVIQEVTEERPFVYLIGQGGLLPAFLSNIEGLKKGDKFNFVLPKEDAYGVPSQERVLELDKKVFEIDGKVDEDILKVGEMIPMEDQEGNALNGIVAEVKDDSVVMDFNHPLAGMDLYFTGKVIDVRDATKEELEHGHAHGPGGHEH